MSALRIVSPEEAQRAASLPFPSGYPDYALPGDLLHTVATEPDRTRAAVVKALREAAERLTYSAHIDVHTMADAIENGADYA
jgi:hypothetical protein